MGIVEVNQQTQPERIEQRNREVFQFHNLIIYALGEVSIKNKHQD